METGKILAFYFCFANIGINLPLCFHSCIQISIYQINSEYFVKSILSDCQLYLVQPEEVGQEGRRPYFEILFSFSLPSELFVSRFKYQLSLFSALISLRSRASSSSFPLRTLCHSLPPFPTVNLTSGKDNISNFGLE